MKSLLMFLVCLGCVIGAGGAGAPVVVTAEESAQVKALLDKLPSQRALWNSLGVISNREHPAEKGQLDAAQEMVKKAHEIVPQLRKLLKVGASVFDYPSLLAHGDLNYGIIKAGSDPFAADDATRIQPEYGYRLYLGLPHAEFIWPHDFQVLFDSLGIIREIKGVDWKK